MEKKLFILMGAVHPPGYTRVFDSKIGKENNRHLSRTYKLRISEYVE